MKVFFLHPQTFQTESLDINEELKRLKSIFKLHEASELKTASFGSLPQIQKEIRDFQPDIIHFAGHGSPFQKIELQVDKNSKNALQVEVKDFEEMLGEITGDLKLLVLNSCFSGLSISHALKHGTDCVIGMKNAIPDLQAINFAESFYLSILKGEPMSLAFKHAAICSPDGNPTIEYREEELANNRFVEPVKPEFDTGDVYYGRKLDELFIKDKLNGVWQVSDPQFSNVPVSLYRVFPSWTHNIDFEIVAEKVGQLTNLFKDEDKEGILKVNRIYGKGNPFVIEYDGIDLDEWMSLEEFSKQMVMPIDFESFKEISNLILKIAEILLIGFSSPEKHIHGILSPDSIIINKKDNSIEVILTDFGLEKLIPRDFINKSDFISPNRKVAHKASASDDVYSIGKIWFNLLASKLDIKPIPEQNFLDWFRPLEAIGMNFQQGQFLASCLSPDIEVRPNNISEFIKGFNDFFGKIIKESYPVTIVDPQSNIDQPAKKFTNSIGMSFVLIEPGNFLMGSSPDEKGRFMDEGPQNRVWLNKPFYISETVVTNDQYLKLIEQEEKNNIRSLLEFIEKNKDDYPIVSIAFANNKFIPIAWEDADRFCLRLTKLQEERHQYGRTYRLPTEAEWEYCCRAGSSTPFSFGKELTPRVANYKLENQSSQLKAAKFYRPNAFGVYQMHGNVWEYCTDFYDTNYYQFTDNENPQGPSPRKGFFSFLNWKKSAKVIRGGDFLSSPQQCRSASREKIFTLRPGGRPRTSPRLNSNMHVGFRLICEIPYFN